MSVNQRRIHLRWRKPQHFFDKTLPLNRMEVATTSKRPWSKIGNAATMSQLILVRHPLPKIVPSQPASQWHQSHEGRRRCKPLAELLSPYHPKKDRTSVEPKAIETGQLVAGFLDNPLAQLQGCPSTNEAMSVLKAERGSSGLWRGSLHIWSHASLARPMSNPLKHRSGIQSGSRRFSRRSKYA
jgi:hypothetical protein